jgi:hypothetical protein
LALLASRLGRARVVLQPWGAARLVDACDGLPQALVIVAALLAGPDEQHTRLRRAASDLRHQPIRPGTKLPGLAAVSALSYRQLPEQQRHTFQLLGLLNTTDIDVGAVAAAADTSADEAERRLRALAIAGLLDGRTGHWRLRPLVLGYARECAEQDLPEPARSEALRRALDHQLRRVRDQRRAIAKVARRDPMKAAQLHAELDRERARSAALVDMAVRDKLDLLGLIAKELADVLHDVITNWPDRKRAEKAFIGIRRVALGGSPEARKRALDWLQMYAGQPIRPPPMETVKRNGEVSVPPGPIDDQGPYVGTVTVSGSGFQPQEWILVNLDNDPGWETSADASGDFTTSTAYGPQPSPPRHVTAVGTSSGRRAEAWLR